MRADLSEPLVCPFRRSPLQRTESCCILSNTSMAVVASPSSLRDLLTSSPNRTISIDKYKQIFSPLTPIFFLIHITSLFTHKHHDCVQD